MKAFLLKKIIFRNFKNLCSLHGHVCVMRAHKQHSGGVEVIISADDLRNYLNNYNFLKNYTYRNILSHVEQNSEKQVLQLASVKLSACVLHTHTEEK